MKHLIFIILLIFIPPLKAVDLFGINLQEATRDQLRNAVKNAGIRLISEAGDDAFYDVYDSQQLLHNSTRLYLGFVKKDAKFAFAEYEFNGLQAQGMLQRLIEKYGKASKSKGKYFTDTAWEWQVNSITIALKTDWKAYKTRLSYKAPAALKQLKQEQLAYQTGISERQNKYLQQAY